MRYAPESTIYLSMPCIAFEGKLENGSGSLCNDSALSIVCDLSGRREMKGERNIIDLDNPIIVEVDF